MRQIIVMIIIVSFIGIASNQERVLAQGKDRDSRANKTSSNSITAGDSATAVTNLSHTNQHNPKTQPQDLIRSKVDAVTLPIKWLELEP